MKVQFIKLKVDFDLKGTPFKLLKSVDQSQLSETFSNLIDSEDNVNLIASKLLMLNPDQTIVSSNISIDKENKIATLEVTLDLNEGFLPLVNMGDQDFFNCTQIIKRKMRTLGIPESAFQTMSGLNSKCGGLKLSEYGAEILYTAFKSALLVRKNFHNGHIIAVPESCRIDCYIVDHEKPLFVESPEDFLHMVLHGGVDLIDDEKWIKKFEQDMRKAA